MAAASDNSRDFDPRHRIVGAIIIVLLVVVFVPLLLGDPEELAKNARIRAEGNGQEVSNGVKRYVTDLSRGETLANQPSSQDKTPTVSVRKTSTSRKPSAATSGKWELRIGTFSKPDNARNLASSLKKLNFPVRSTELDNGHTRIWMGTYANQAEARKMAEKLQKLAKVKAIVVKRQ
ncbi:MAG: hypothetical protein DSZ32_06435 [Gammaproteobacteria bacterium]|nr:MAG: hypothetical protein DSZ32_06435 [Gammaproteobacteria bacterium]